MRNPTQPVARRSQLAGSGIGVSVESVELGKSSLNVWLAALGTTDNPKMAVKNESPLEEGTCWYVWLWLKLFFEIVNVSPFIPDIATPLFTVA
jgi:hypothetical protein